MNEHISDRVHIISSTYSSFAEQEGLLNPTLTTTHQVIVWWEPTPATQFLRFPASSTVVFDVWLKIFCEQAESCVKLLLRKAFSHNSLNPYSTAGWWIGLRGGLCTHKQQNVVISQKGYHRNSQEFLIFLSITCAQTKTSFQPVPWEISVTCLVQCVQLPHFPSPHTQLHIPLPFPQRATVMRSWTKSYCLNGFILVQLNLWLLMEQLIFSITLPTGDLRSIKQHWTQNQNCTVVSSLKAWVTVMLRVLTGDTILPSLFPPNPGSQPELLHLRACRGTDYGKNWRALLQIWLCRPLPYAWRVHVSSQTWMSVLSSRKGSGLLHLSSFNTGMWPLSLP